MVHLARGSGVSVYRMNRSPRGGRARSPWVIKKSDEGILARERRRVERALELESRVLSRIEHPHIVGFRAAQRLPDGRLGLVLEACECSLYGLIQERQFELGCPPRPFLAAADVLAVATGIALALVHLHDEMDLLHGDIKSANVLVARDLSLVKVCDLGVALPLCACSALEGAREQPRPLQLPDEHAYQGTEAWRPPEACYDACGSPCGEAPGGCPWAEEDEGAEMEPEPKPPALEVSDRSDLWALGLVVWEMLTGEVPHSHHSRLEGMGHAYYAALGTRPPLPPEVSAAGEAYRLPLQLLYACTQREPHQRPSARQVARQLVKALAQEGRAMAQAEGLLARPALCG